jgi:hypothetical protein
LIRTVSSSSGLETILIALQVCMYSASYKDS